MLVMLNQNNVQKSLLATSILYTFCRGSVKIQEEEVKEVKKVRKEEAALTVPVVAKASARSAASASAQDAAQAAAKAAAKAAAQAAAQEAVA